LPLVGAVKRFAPEARVSLSVWPQATRKNPDVPLASTITATAPPVATKTRDERQTGREECDERDGGISMGKVPWRLRD